MAIIMFRKAAEQFKEGTFNEYLYACGDNKSVKEIEEEVVSILNHNKALSPEGEKFLLPNKLGG